MEERSKPRTSARSTLETRPDNLRSNETGRAVKNIRTVFLVNVIFTVIELVGGVLTNSVAILADALHDLGDSFSFGLAWYLEKFSNKKRDERFSYGYKRFSLLAALINAAILLFGSVFILTKTIPRLWQPVLPQATGMIGLAVLGVLANSLAAWQVRRGQTMNEKMVALNLLEDIFGWLVILVASVVIKLTGWVVLDPLLSIMVIGYILLGVLKNLRQVGLLFLQAAPKNLSPGKVKKALEDLPEVVDVHDIHLWSLDGEKHILSAHIVVDKNLPKERVRFVRRLVKDKLKELGITHSTLEIEFTGEKCLDDNELY